MPELNCIVVTPEETALEQSCVFVAVPLFDGEKGVAYNHAPMIGRMGCGELRLRTSDNQVARYYVDGGFVQIVDNTVSIMTNRAIPAAKLDAATARNLLSEASSRKATTDDTWEAKNKAVTRGPRSASRKSKFRIWDKMPQPRRQVGRPSRPRSSSNQLGNNQSAYLSSLRIWDKMPQPSPTGREIAVVFGSMPSIGRIFPRFSPRISRLD